MWKMPMSPAAASSSLSVSILAQHHSLCLTHPWKDALQNLVASVEGVRNPGEVCLMGNAYRHASCADKLI